MSLKDESIIRCFILNNTFMDNKNLNCKMNKIRNIINLYSYLIENFNRIFSFSQMKTNIKLQKKFKILYQKNLDLQTEFILLKNNLEKKKEKHIFDIFVLNESLNILEKYIYFCKNYYVDIQLILFEKTNHCMDLSKQILTFL